jgi:hypothetical protein
MQQLVLPFTLQCIVMHEASSSSLSASVSSLQVCCFLYHRIILSNCYSPRLFRVISLFHRQIKLSERSVRQLHALWGAWAQHFFHIQSYLDHQQHHSSFRPPSASVAGLYESGSSSTDVRVQLLELRCSRSTTAVEVQLSLKAMEATGLVIVVPAPLALHAREAPQHMIAIFGRKTSASLGATSELAGSSDGGWVWKSSLGGCSIELLQHNMAPWVVFEGMSVSFAKMADAAYRNRAEYAYRGSPSLRGSLSNSNLSNSNRPAVIRSTAQQHDDTAVDLSAHVHIGLDTKRENDSLRLLLGSYESHFTRMRQQLQQLLPHGLISRDLDGKASLFFLL